MSNVVQQAKALDVLLNGNILFGNIEEFNVPDLELQTEEVRPGTDGIIDVETGLAKMDVELMVRGIHVDVASAFGGTGEPNTRIEARVALENVNVEGAKNLTYTCVGLAKMYSEDSLQGRGELPKSTLTMNCYYFKKVQDGVTVHEIDVMNDIRMTNGVDRLAAIRAAIGI